MRLHSAPPLHPSTVRAPEHQSGGTRGGITTGSCTCGYISSCDDRQVPPGSRCSLLSNAEVDWPPGERGAVRLTSRPAVCFSADQVQELVAECLRARDRAYCPYSRFPVGAAVLSADGAIITGDSPTPPDCHTSSHLWQFPFFECLFSEI